MRAHGAIEEVFLLVLFAFGGAGVGIWVGDLGGSAVETDVNAVAHRENGGEGGGGEDIAGRKRVLVQGRSRMIKEGRYGGGGNWRA